MLLIQKTHNNGSALAVSVWNWNMDKTEWWGTGGKKVVKSVGTVTWDWSDQDFGRGLGTENKEGVSSKVFFRDILKALFYIEEPPRLAQESRISKADFW